MTTLQRAQLSLDGLSVGDSFGQKFFGNQDTMMAMIDQRAIPSPPWYLTDDSIMAIAVVDTLKTFGRIDQDYLASKFAENYVRNPYRCYGAMAQSLLRSISLGQDWRELASGQFNGQGSYGNGAAMRVGPLGAYFADNINLLCEQAVLSAEVTHAHSEGKAGALAVALAASWVVNHPQSLDGMNMLKFVHGNLPSGETRSGIATACDLPFSYQVETAVKALGNGTMISAQDTVPFSLWCAARHLGDYAEALWTTVRGLGDRDTTCAIVGSIVSLGICHQGIPAEWREARESLTEWAGTEWGGY